MPHFSLHTLLIVMAIGPPILAGSWYWFSRTGLAGLGAVLPLSLITCYLLAWYWVFATLRAADRTDG